MVANRCIRARELAPAVFAGFQPGFGRVPSSSLYNLTADIPDRPTGSTVTVSGETLVAAGYDLAASEAPRELPTSENCPQSMVILDVVRHPGGGYTHAEPINATRTTERIYRGWWRTKRAAQHALDSKFSFHAR